LNKKIGADKSDRTLAAFPALSDKNYHSYDMLYHKDLAVDSNVTKDIEKFFGW
jgi:hypothetical protein